MFVEHTPEELEKLKARYATTGSVLEAPKLIAAKAKSMLWHYVSTVLPDGFKAQVSRHQPAGHRALPRGLPERPATTWCAKSKQLPERLVLGTADGSLDIDRLDRKTQVLRAGPPSARPHQASGLRSGHLRGATTMTRPGRQWTDKARQDAVIADFKKTLGLPGRRPALLLFCSCVPCCSPASMHLSSRCSTSIAFIQDAELLQAIARVNRTAAGKTAGLLVDYFGVGAHLQKALTSLRSQKMPRMRSAHWPRSADNCRSCAIGTLALSPSLPRQASRPSTLMKMSKPALKSWPTRPCALGFERLAQINS